MGLMRSWSRMAKFALARGESPSHGLRRTVAEEIRVATCGLKTLPPMEAIHEFRRATKHIRALLQLGCRDKGEQQLRDCFKTLALKASTARDLSVRERLLAKMRGDCSRPREIRLCEYLEQR